MADLLVRDDVDSVTVDRAGVFAKSGGRTFVIDRDVLDGLGSLLESRERFDRLLAERVELLEEFRKQVEASVGIREVLAELAEVRAEMERMRHLLVPVNTMVKAFRDAKTSKELIEEERDRECQHISGGV